MAARVDGERLSEEPLTASQGAAIRQRLLKIATQMDAATDRDKYDDADRIKLLDCFAEDVRLCVARLLGGSQ